MLEIGGTRLTTLELIFVQVPRRGRTVEHGHPLDAGTILSWGIGVERQLNDQQCESAAEADVLAGSRRK